VTAAFGACFLSCTDKNTDKNFRVRDWCDHDRFRFAPLERRCRADAPAASQEAEAIRCQQLEGVSWENYDRKIPQRIERAIAWLFESRREKQRTANDCNERSDRADERSEQATARGSEQATGHEQESQSQPACAETDKLAATSAPMPATRASEPDDVFEMMADLGVI
jgi:hypothetical protein